MTSTEAKRRLANLEAEVARALADVTEAREALSVGDAEQRDVIAAQRALAKLTERQEQARVDLKVATRREEQDAAIAAREADRIRLELRKIHEARRQAQIASLRTWLRGVAADAQEYDRSLQEIDAQIGERSGLVPSTLRCWREWTASLAATITAVDPPRATYDQENAK